MKIHTSTALLIALATPFASGQTSAPSAADSSFDSLAPSPALPIESLVPTIAVDSAAPTETVEIESLAPSAAVPIESSVPSASLEIESLIPSATVDVPAPTPGAATPAPFAADDTTANESSAPSISIPVESLVPTGIEFDSAVPTGTEFDSSAPSSTPLLESLVPSSAITTGDQPQFDIDPKCSAHELCLVEGLDDDCCPTSTGTFLACCDLGTPNTADPLDLDEIEPDEPVVLTPKNAPGCIRARSSNDDDYLMLATCNASDENQQFKFVGSQIRLVMDESKCLQAGRIGTPSHGNYIRVFPCDSSNDLQKFSFTPEGRVYPSDYPGVTVVYRGTNANVNSDRIIIGDMAVEDVVDREAWTVFN